MKLTLTVNKPPNRASFQASDVVQGRVDLQLDQALAVPDICVLLQATAKITLKPGFDTTAQVGDTRRRRSIRLFTSSQVVKPACQGVREDDYGSTSSSAQRVVTAAFDIPFPPFSCCCRRDSDNSSRTTKLPFCRLPPSTTFSTPALRVNIAYSVTAVCRRPGSGLLSQLLHSKNVVASQSITFAPSEAEQLLCGPYTPPSEPQIQLLPSSPCQPLPATCKLIRSTAWLSSSTLGVDGSHSSNANVGPPGFLPPYSPAIRLDVVMPYPPVVTPGRTIALGLNLKTPRTVLDAANDKRACLQLSSLSIRLRRQTQGSIGKSLRVDDTIWPMWSMHGNVPIQQEKLNISWITAAAGDGEQTTAGNLLVLSVPASAAILHQPGFWTCFASRTYSIEVSVGMTVVRMPTALDECPREKRKSSEQSQVQYARAAVRVMISDPPPDYGAGQVDRQAPQSACLECD
ncbi:hypothetical protein SEPCBS119000_003765 [Sporothrix epigloea]|uniref:Arrestin-like N-terminal domain-containing protein n=1 Tax=Sporothrix epigloea TaxID=1892477 RepID=A0ABP0DR76_9PEZI